VQSGWRVRSPLARCHVPLLEVRAHWVALATSARKHAASRRAVRRAPLAGVGQRCVPHQSVSLSLSLSVFLASLSPGFFGWSAVAPGLAGGVLAGTSGFGLADPWVIGGCSAGFGAGFASGLAAGFSTGFGAGFASGLTAGFSAGFGAGFASGLAAGFSAGLSAGFASGFGAGFSTGLAPGFAGAAARASSAAPRGATSTLTA